MSVPQHELQDFLRTAELLEIKGLLKSPSAAVADLDPPPPPPPQATPATSFATHHHLVAASCSPLTAAVQQQQQQQAVAAAAAAANALPALPTVPVSSLLLGTAPATITDGGECVAIRLPNVIYIFFGQTGNSTLQYYALIQIIYHFSRH